MSSPLKTLTINGKTFTVTPVVPTSTVTLLASAWEGEGDKYSQVVEIPEVTSHTKVDLQLTSDQAVAFHPKVLGFVAENDGGVVEVFAIGCKPANDHTLQVTLTEVEATGKIRGNFVSTTVPRSNWAQTDPTKADYIENKPDALGGNGQANLMQTDPTKPDYVKGKEEFLAQVGAGSGQNVALLDVDPGEAFYLVTGDAAVGRILLSTTSLSITEGESTTFTVRLSAAPGEAQVVRLMANHEDIHLAPESLTFTPDNYGTEQVVTVTVATDADAVSESGFITATSSSAGFAEIAVAIVDKDADAVRTKYTYVFNVDSSAAPDRTLTLVANPNGDGVTNWGDGTVDALTTHAYADYGTYTVVTDNTLVINEGAARSASQKALTRVESWSDALHVHTDGSHNAYRLFYECINLAYCADVPRGYTALTDTFRNTRALKTAPAISGTVTDMENTFWSSGITAPPAIPTSVTKLHFAFNYCTAMTTAPDLHPGVTNAASMCRNCSSLTDTREPWNISFAGNINAEGCFTNCYKLDLTTVPTTWGGTMEVN